MEVEQEGDDDDQFDFNDNQNEQRFQTERVPGADPEVDHDDSSGFRFGVQQKRVIDTNLNSKVDEIMENENEEEEGDQDDSVRDRAPSFIQTRYDLLKK